MSNLYLVLLILPLSHHDSPTHKRPAQVLTRCANIWCVQSVVCDLSSHQVVVCQRLVKQFYPFTLLQPCMAYHHSLRCASCLDAVIQYKI